MGNTKYAKFTMKIIEKGKTRRRETVPGDLFSIHIPGIGWLYALVAKSDVWVVAKNNKWVPEGQGPFELIYIFDSITKNRLPNPSLSKHKLLLDPIICNRTPWTTGKFEFLKKIPLTDDLVFERHCFYNPFFEKYFDEMGNVVPEKFLPCGTHGMASSTSIEYDLGRKLNLIPLDDH